MKRMSLACISALAISSYAHAFDLGSFDSMFDSSYVSAGIGADFPGQNWSSTQNSDSVLYAPTAIGTSLFQLQNVHWKNKYQTGYEANIAAGTRYCSDWRIEAEFLYQNFDRSVNGSYDWVELYPGIGDVFASQLDNHIGKRSRELNTYSLLANAYYDIKNDSGFTPFIGGGIGVAWVNSDETDTHNTLVINDLTSHITASAPTYEHGPSLSSTVFAWQVKAGVSYDLDCHISLVAQYNLFGTTDLHAGKSKIITNPNTPGQAIFTVPSKNVRGLLNNTLDFGVRYTF